MARLSARLPENVEGEFFVDSSCIDCATCRLVAPAVFGRSPRARAFVERQPRSPAETQRALMALVACPTASIGTRGRHAAGAAARRFPELLEDEVYYCGFASADSYGASSYLIRRAEGNVLVDSPRASRPLLDRLAALGGVQFLFLTHRDDVADHEALRRRFDCERILHAADAGPGTRGVERLLRGRSEVTLAHDLVAIPVPGHTPGSTALLYRQSFLFSGDHLMGTEDGTRLHASRSVCWHSWPEQLRSIERLTAYRFYWILPGHGGRFRASSPAAMDAAIQILLCGLREERRAQ